MIKGISRTSIGLRRFSVLSRVQGMLESVSQRRQEKAELESKQKLFNVLRNTEEYTVNVYYQQLLDAEKDATSGLRSVLPQDEAGLAEIQANKSIIEAMTYSQRQRYGRVRSEMDRKILAKRSGQSVEKVEQFLQQFDFLFKVFWWMKNHEGKDSDSVAENLDEVIKKMSQSRRGLRRPPAMNQLQKHNDDQKKKAFEKARKLQPRKFLKEFQKVR